MKTHLHQSKQEQRIESGIKKRTASNQLISIKGMIKLTPLPFKDHSTTSANLLRLLIQERAFLASRFNKQIVCQSTLNTHT